MTGLQLPRENLDKLVFGERLDGEIVLALTDADLCRLECGQ